MQEKLYPFSSKKHIHDLSFRSDRLANDIARFGAKYANSTTVKYMQELKEQLDAIICKAAGGVSPIWLTGKEYALAMDSVGWAAEHRR